MKWDEEADPDDADEDDNAEFDKIRKVCPQSGCFGIRYGLTLSAGTANLHGFHPVYRPRTGH